MCVVDYSVPVLAVCPCAKLSLTTLATTDFPQKIHLIQQPKTVVECLFFCNFLPKPQPPLTPTEKEMETVKMFSLLLIRGRGAGRQGGDLGNFSWGGSGFLALGGRGGKV